MSLIETAESPRPEVDAERIASRHLILLLKQLVKADAVTIRSAKRAVRELQRAGLAAARPAQAGLAALRRDARVRLLVYGFARGRTWEQMEVIHASGDRALAPHLLGAWRAAEQSAARVTGTLPPLPETLCAHVPGGAA
jgi:hypothetical protein